MPDVTRKSALTGVRVADLSSGIAGPLAAMWLGDFGAEVIRVEPREGSTDRVGLAGVPMWDRNKRVIRRDPDSPEVRSLVLGADVVITSSTSVDAALGLNAEDTASSATHLIHLSMPSFGGSEDVDATTSDALTSAATGLARRQSSFGGGPVESVYPHISYVQGAWGAICAIAALIEREHSGRGQVLQVDGLHGALVATTPTMVVDLDRETPSTAVGPSGPNPVYSPYRCSDGRWLFLGALLPKFQNRAFDLLGISDIFGDPRIGGDNTKLYSPDNRDWVRNRIAAAFALRPRDHWLESLAEHDCPAGPVDSRTTWLAHPQVVALGQRRTMTDPEVGQVSTPWVPVELSATPAIEPAPRQSVESTAWTAGGFTGEPRGPNSSKGPLAGIRVIDLGTILAGPFSGMLLAELGADVVKVEPPGGDSFRVAGFQYNRGQRSLAVDLRDPQGHAAFLKLVAGSDVVIDNYRPGVLERLKIDYNELTGVRPDIISTSITGFGSTGPLAGRPGFDPILQAMSGMMAAQGGDSEPVFFTMAINDVTAACVSALGICAALYNRARGGGGQRVSTSLCAVSTYMQSGELVEFQGRKPAPRGRRDYPGPSPLSRYYKTADGYVRLHVSSARQLVDAGILSAAPPAGDAVEELVAASIRSLSNAQVVKQVEAAGAWAVPARTQADLARDSGVLDGGYLAPLTRSDKKSFYVPGRFARFSRTEQDRLLIPPGLGEHSREVLIEVGLTADAVDALAASGSIVQGSPMTEFGGVGYR